RMAEIAEQISRAYRNKEEVGVVVFHPFENELVTGVVSEVDAIRKRIKITDTWIALDSITDIDSSP
ncbi:MAG: YolD-like protein, partial [Paenibacillus sp.]|nr:YolD-like protein [Paenibacillus sp.]